MMRWRKRIAARWGHRGEGGFALTLALVVLAFASLIIISLLGLATATTMSNTAIERANRETRAADSALDTAINRIRLDGTGVLGSVDQCATQHFPYTATDGPNATQVDVTCVVPSGFSPTLVPSAPPAAGPAAQVPNVAVVGDTYFGNVKWKQDCTPANPPDPGPGCFPWTYALGAGRYAASRSTVEAHPATVVASGPSALSFTSDLTVAQGMVALRNNGTSTLGGPGVLVGGKYAQGQNGLFAQAGIPCGILSPQHPWGIGAAQVATVGDNMACGSTTPAMAVPAVATPGWSASDVAAKRVSSVPACSGSMITFATGAYDSVATAGLNALFDGSCPTRTFVFPAGDYWFDGPSGAARNSLVINDATSRFIFGTPSAAATFPRACDPAAGGVSITLSPRTSITHRAGRVAVCATNASPTTNKAIVQDPGADSGWTATPAAVSATVTGKQTMVNQNPVINIASTPTLVNSPSAALAADGSNFEAYLPCLEPSDPSIFTGGFYNLRSCSGTATFTYSGWGSAPAPAPVNSAMLVLTGQAVRANGGYEGYGFEPISTTRIDVTAPSGTCSVTYSQVLRQTDATPVAYELLDDNHRTAGQTSCTSVLKNRTDLAAASVTVTMTLKAECPEVFWDPILQVFGSIHPELRCAGDQFGIKLDGAQIRTSEVTTPGTLAPGTEFADPGTGVFANGGPIAFSGYQTCVGSCSKVTKSMTLSGFDNRDAPPVPSDAKVGSAMVLVTGWANNANGMVTGSRSDTTVDVTLPGGGTCSAVVAGVPGARLFQASNEPNPNQTIAVDLLTADAPSGKTRCHDVVAGVTADVLRGSVLKVTEGLVCQIICLASRNFDLNLDRVALSVTSAGPYSHPTAPNTFTINDAAGTSFNVFGGIAMPRATLDLAWRGTPTDTPVLNGSSVIGALGSDMSPNASAGVSCCSPGQAANRLVRLEARVDGRLRASALVQIIDVDNGVRSMGKAIEIRDWRYCTDPRCGGT